MTTQLEERLRATLPDDLDPPDLGEVRRRGQRRRLATRGSVVLASVAALAVVVTGASQVLGPASQEPVGPAIESDGATSGRSEPLRAEQVAAELDLDVLAVTYVPEAFTGWTITRTTPDGDRTSTDWSRDAEAGVPLATPDGRLWTMSAGGSTVRFDPVSGIEMEIVTARETGWSPLTPAPDGGIVATAVVAESGSPTTEGGGAALQRPSSSLLRVVSVDGTLRAVPGVVDGVAGDGFVAAAAVGDELSAVVVLDGGGSSRLVVLADGDDPATARTTDDDRRLSDVAVVGDEIWAVEAGAGALDAELLRFDRQAELVASTPLDLGGPVAWRMAVAPDGGHVVLPAGPRSAVPVSHVLDVAAIRGGTAPADAALRLDEPGIVTLLPPTTEPAATSRQDETAATASQDAPPGSPLDTETRFQLYRDGGPTAMGAMLVVGGFLLVIVALARWSRRREEDGSFDVGPSSAARPGLKRLFDFGPGGWSRDGRNQRPRG